MAEDTPPIAASVMMSSTFPRPSVIFLPIVTLYVALAAWPATASLDEKE